jgi:hypothetical protein
MSNNRIGNLHPLSRRLEQNLPDATSPDIRLLVILDRSLSMAPHEELVAGALRNFVSTLCKAPNHLRYVTTLIEFADGAETVLHRQPLENLAVTYKANGQGTALWDAMALAFTLEKSRQDRVICLVVSDGEENCSREADQKQVASMVRSRIEWGNWTFLWLNLQGKPSKSARSLGLNCFDSSCDQIGKALPQVAEQICRVAARVTADDRKSVEGGRR